MEVTRKFSQQKKKRFYTHYHGFRFADTCKSPKMKCLSEAKYFFLFLCFILKRKIQGHAQLAITFYVQGCEYASLGEAVFLLLLFFYFFITQMLSHFKALYQPCKKCRR